MPPRKKPISTSTPSAPLPPPNESHPSYSQLSSTLSQLPLRPHSTSYHQFFNSPLSAPPKKKQKLTTESESEVKWEVEVIQEKLLDWFEGKREERKMPWRKDVRVDEMSKKERSQRGYEVRSIRARQQSYSRFLTLLRIHSVLQVWVSEVSSLSSSSRSQSIVLKRLPKVDHVTTNPSSDSYCLLQSMDHCVPNGQTPLRSDTRRSQFNLDWIRILFESETIV